MKEDWELELEAELDKRRRDKVSLSVKQIAKRYNVAFSSWEGYHEGDSPNLMYLLRQLGYKHAEELDYIAGGKDINPGYLFVYSQKPLSATRLKAISRHLGLDLKDKYNVDFWYV